MNVSVFTISFPTSPYHLVAVQTYFIFACAEVGTKAADHIWFYNYSAQERKEILSVWDIAFRWLHLTVVIVHKFS